MNERIVVTLTFLALLGSGMIAGVFLAFSSFIMAGLGRLPASSGITAMQNINVTVINPLFMAILFGTALFCLALAFMALRNGDLPQSSMLLVATSLYVVGVIGLTMVFNVPLNNELAAVSAQSDVGATLWSRYLVDWTFWNTLRGLSAFISCVVFALTLVQLG